MALDSVKKYVKDKFAAINLVISSDMSEEQNPAVESALSSIQKPSVGKIDSFEYIKYGQDDKLDLVYDSLLYKSATHSGILSKKAKMVAGNKLVVDGEDSLGKSEKMLWDAFKSRCGGLGNPLYSVLKSAAYFYEKDGAVGLDITYDKGFASIISIKAVQQKDLRCGLPDSKTNEITHYIKRIGGFKRSSSKAIPIKEEKIAAFDVINEKDTRQLLYIRNPLSTSDYYGMPNYLGAYYFIAADFEFGKSILNSAKNGFSPKLLATFIGRNVSKDAMREEGENFKSNFTGSDGEQVVLSWIRKSEDAPIFKSLDIPNLDKTISVMANLDDAKILTAHNITSPTLFGIMVAGKLGGTGNELQTAYELFRVTETLPNRELLIDGFQSILNRVPKYIDKLKITVEDIVIDFGTKNTSSENDTSQVEENLK